LDAKKAKAAQRMSGFFVYQIEKKIAQKFVYINFCLSLPWFNPLITTSYEIKTTILIGGFAFPFGLRPI
jgi:hypothetical protein